MNKSVFRAGRSLAFSNRPLAAASAALLATTALASPALAQTAQTVPDAFQHLDGNGVDLVTGRYSASFVEGAIGSGENALVLRRLANGGSNYENFYTIQSSANGVLTVDVMLGDRRETFRSTNGGAFVNLAGNGATLSGSGELGYTFRSAGGTTISFGNPQQTAGTTPFCQTGGDPNGCRTAALWVTEPNGRSVSFEWSVREQCTLDQQNEIICNIIGFRLGRVSNSAGYAIDFAYASSNAASADWLRRTSASFSNTLVTGGSDVRTVSYARPATGVVDFTDMGGRVWRFSYDSSSRLTGVRRPGTTADAITIGYGANGVSSVTSGGVTTAYSRVVLDGDVTMTITNALNQQIVVSSNLTIGRPSSIKDPLNRITSYEYDSEKRITRIVAPELNELLYTYDPRGNVISTRIVARPNSGEDDIVTSATYAANCDNPVTCNSPLTTTDARNNVTEYTWHNVHGQLLAVTGPAAPGGVRPQVRYRYGTVHGEIAHLYTSICQTGAAATPGTDEEGDTIVPAAACEGTADEVRSSMSYDVNGNVTGTTTSAGDNSLSAAQAMTYSVLGDLLTIDGPLTGSADTVRLRYNAGRELVGMVGPDPDGSGSLQHRAMRSILNTEGLVERVDVGTVADQSDSAFADMAVHQSTRTTFDDHARPVVQRLTSGSDTYALRQTSYDALGRPECGAVRMNPAAFDSLPSSACTLGTEGSFGPDRIGRMVYDAAGQVTQMQTAVGTADEANEAVLTYTANGQVETLTDGEGNRSTFVYDGHGRLHRTRYPVATVGADTSSTTDYEQYGYDQAGNVTSFRNRADETANFAYDALGRMTGLDRPGSEPDATFGHDNLGRLTSASQPGHTLAFTYDALGRQISEAGPQATVQRTFDSGGRQTSLRTLRGGVQNYYVGYQHLVTGELTAILDGQPQPQTLASFGYDQLGRRTSLAQAHGGTTSYGYDAVSRLTSHSIDNPGDGADNAFTLSYNPAGQVVERTTSHQAVPYNEHANLNRSDSVNGLNQISQSGSATVTHDARGNMTSDGTRTFGYRSDNAMTSASGGVTLSYDPLGRLSEISSPSGTRQLVHDGPSLIQEYGSGSMAAAYVHGARIDEPLVEYDGSGNRRHLMSDDRGSIIAPADDTGLVLGVNRYDEYGVPSSSNTGRFQYNGQPWLPEIGMYYSRARMYDPVRGRFPQPDPIGYGDGANLYNAFGGDPVNRSDPSGMRRACVRVDNGAWKCGRNEEDWRRLLARPLTDVGISWRQPGDGFGGEGGDLSKQARSPCSGPSSARAPGAVAVRVGPVAGRVGAATAVAGVLSAVAGIIAVAADYHLPNYPIYRSVGPAELTSIVSTGQFLPRPGGLEVKQFWTSLADAERFATMSISRGMERSTTIVSTRISGSTFNMAEQIPLDGRFALSFSGPSLVALNGDARYSGIRVEKSC